MDFVLNYSSKLITLNYGTQFCHQNILVLGKFCIACLPFGLHCQQFCVLPASGFLFIYAF